MNLLTPHTSVGLSVVGEDLIVVEASVRGEQARWSSSRLAGFFEEGADAPAAGSRGASTPVALTWPMDRMLRRDVALGEQSLDDLKVAVRESPDAFFPVVRDEGLLWDAHEFVDAEGVRRAILFAVRLPEIEAILGRLAQAGLTPTRLVPSGAAWDVLRFVHDEAPSEALEIGAKGWSVSSYDGLRWTGLYSGFGAAPAELRERARREGWAVCDWRSPPKSVGETSVWRPDELTAEHAALGAALLELARDGDEEGERLPRIDLLGTPTKRRMRVGALGWFAAACAGVVIALLVWNDAAHARAVREERALKAEVARLTPMFDRVEGLRAQAAAVLKAHERLRGLEASYRPMCATLAELAVVVPKDSYLAKIDFADSGVSADAVTPSRTELLTAIDASPIFGGIGVTTGSTRLPGGNEQFGLAFGFEKPAPAANADASRGVTP